MANGRINAVTGLKTIEVSLVKQGANRKTFAFFKSEDGMEDLQEIIEAVLNTEAEGEEKLEKVFKQDGMDENGMAVVRALMRMLSAFKDKLPDDVMTKLAKISDYPMPEKKQADGKDEYPTPTAKAEHEEEEKKKIAKQEEEEEKKKEEIAKQEEEDEKEKLMKAGHMPIKKDGSPDFGALPASAQAMRPMLEALWKNNLDTQALLKSSQSEVKVERDLRILKEQTEKAKSEYGNLGKAEDLGVILKSLDEQDSKLSKSVQAILKSANELIDQGQLFDTIGSGRVPDSSSAEQQLETLAKTLIQKSVKELSYEQAYAKALKTPEGKRLYEEHRGQKTQH